MVPCPLLVFHPEFAQKKAGAQHGHPGIADRIPMQLVLTDTGRSAPGPSIPRWIPAAQEPFSGYVPCFRHPSNLVRPPTAQQKEATVKAQLATV